MFIIEDWTGKRKFPEHSFNTFEDGWDFILANVPNDEDLQEFYVEEDSS